MNDTTTPQTLTERRPPWLIVTHTDDPWVTTATTELTDHGGTVIHLPGPNLNTPAAIFTTFARALNFPRYFGHNWDALVDCLNDWHPHTTAGKGLTVVIDHADHLAHADFLGIFVSVLCQAAWNANRRLDTDGNPHDERPAYPLHFILLTEQTTPAAFTDGATTGMDVAVTVTDGRLTATLTGPDWP
ncbi:barstar family protein [Actinoplanes couchii]|uniref:Barstar (barnase inhibitor) domain-containing protein n=1 Tax=Actinoplanes couchii TaxID=403638 RepID=A0ABQ3XLQ0_9ACTN|nr:barstar family protein [Actinoplanes couchii]MDR6319372.1 RNAse (barnase) inhibitor barstar [Actinoplanes couchii]GID59418.1 hypothetical protein Aco03nite_078220 [Actinoplanes couchii]